MYVTTTRSRFESDQQNQSKRMVMQSVRLRAKPDTHTVSPFPAESCEVHRRWHGVNENIFGYYWIVQSVLVRGSNTSNRPYAMHQRKHKTSESTLCTIAWRERRSYDYKRFPGFCVFSQEVAIIQSISEEETWNTYWLHRSLGTPKAYTRTWHTTMSDCSFSMYVAVWTYYFRFV